MDNFVVDNFACPYQGGLQPVSNNAGFLLDEFEELKRRIMQSKWGHIEGPAPIEPAPVKPAPILALPNEITLLIFTLVCDSSQPLSRKPIASIFDDSDCIEQKQYISERAQEMTISHVCHAWREICIDYPFLWSNFNHFQNSSVARLEDRLTAYLARAQAIMIDPWAHVSVFDVLQCLTMIQAIDNTPWRQIYMVFNKTSGHSSPIPTGLVNAMHSKQDVDLDYQRGLLIHTRNIRHNCLSHLQLDSVTVGQQRRLPWTDFLVILSEFPSLVSLSLSKLIFDPPQGQPNLEEINAVVAPALQYFRCADKNVATWMWLYFRAPQLKLLSLDNILIHDTYLQHFEDVVHRMHEHVFPSLKTLVFTDCLFHCHLHPDGMRPVIKATRNITHLKVSYSLSAGAAHKTPLYWMTQVLPQKEVWSHLNTVSIIRRQLLPNENIFDEENISEFLNRIIERRWLLNHFCKLRMHDDLARQWKAKDPILWDCMVAEELFEHLPPSIPNDAGYWLTEWPPIEENTGFHWKSENSYIF